MATPLKLSEQHRVFERYPTGTRKIIISTNIAETSVTIDDVVVVIDAGRSNQTQYDPGFQFHYDALTLPSKANVQPRRVVDFAS